jgi:hypothetical protein
MLIVSWSFGKLVIYKDKTAAFMGTTVLEDIGYPTRKHAAHLQAITD